MKLIDLRKGHLEGQSHSPVQQGESLVRLEANTWGEGKIILKFLQEDNVDDNNNNAKVSQYLKIQMS